MESCHRKGRPPVTGAATSWAATGWAPARRARRRVAGGVRLSLAVPIALTLMGLHSGAALAPAHGGPAAALRASAPVARQESTSEVGLTVVRLTEAADAVRLDAVRRSSASAEPPARGADQEDGPVGALLDVAHGIAGAPDVAAAWRSAEPVAALREAAIPMGRGERVALVCALVELSRVAPTDDDAVDVLTFAAELAEPLADPDSPGAVAARALLDGSAEQQLTGAEHPGGHASSAAQEAARLDAEMGRTVRRALGRIGQITGERPDALLARLRLRSATLATGEPAPAYAGRDTAGNEVHSSDLLGRIVVLRFWEHDVPASLAAHERDMVLLRRHWDAPVDVVGVSTDPDRARHVERMQDLRLGGTQLYEGPIGTNLADALARRTDVTPSVSGGGASGPGASGAGAVPPPPASEALLDPSPGDLFVLDAAGRVRGRDLSHRELDQLLAHLVAEHRATIRARRAGAAGASGDPREPRRAPETSHRDSPPVGQGRPPILQTSDDGAAGDRTTTTPPRAVSLGAAPMGAVPMSAVPTSAVPTSAVPTSAVPTSAMRPGGAAPPETPSDARSFDGRGGHDASTRPRAR